MNVIKVAMIGVISVLVGESIKEIKPAYVIYIVFTGMLIVALYIIFSMESIINGTYELLKSSGIDNSYLFICFKIFGIAYVSEAAAAICKDLGHNSIASQIETFAKLSILVMGYPMIGTLIESVINI